MLGEERRAEHQGALTEPASGRLASPDIRDEFGLETIDMNMGPQHPAMHGLLRLILELDGETVVRCDPVMGYLHRCQEKIAENRMYPAVIPLTDRLDYFANMHNEHGYCLAVEDLLDVEIPPRAEYIRVLMCELMRLASHIPSIGFLMLELGAFTPILYAFRERERIQTIFEAVTGARMMFHYIRIGGVKADLPPDIPQKIWEYIESLEAHFQRDFVDLIQGNEIFISRTRNVGRMTQEQAVEMGVTGPALRCTGVDFDIRMRLSIQRLPRTGVRGHHGYGGRRRSLLQGPYRRVLAEHQAHQAVPGTDARGRGNGGYGPPHPSGRRRGLRKGREPPR